MLHFLEPKHGMTGSMLPLLEAGIATIWELGCMSSRAAAPWNGSALQEHPWGRNSHAKELGGPAAPLTPAGLGRQG